MDLDRFLAWLVYCGCEEIEDNRLYFLYQNKENQQTAPIPNEAKIFKQNMYLICLSLKIDMPVEFGKYQRQLDKIYKNADL
ncbi:hypothetical protein SAMN00120144_2106 [Hymenobacter roseosalivarius DSM 11622]|uniref:Uncharacterized protein n=1 Tax=Hymenobacter roseosalivarius DSM 11622 TaxID=645990 RepID=A0A1W1VFN5_9BACT|nr:hypothetical protein SAMN00120144_2106 [Hymenobacter roseosalivarius DSM 11622]